MTRNPGARGHADAGPFSLHAHAGIVKQLTVVLQHLDGDSQFHGHHPRIALVHRLGHAVIHRRDQRQRRLPTATALASDSVLAATAGGVVSGMDELVAQCAAALALVEPVGQ